MLLQALLLDSVWACQATKQRTDPPTLATFQEHDSSPALDSTDANSTTASAHSRNRLVALPPSQPFPLRSTGSVCELCSSNISRDASKLARWLSMDECVTPSPLDYFELRPPPLPSGPPLPYYPPTFPVPIFFLVLLVPAQAASRGRPDRRLALTASPRPEMN